MLVLYFAFVVFFSFYKLCERVRWLNWKCCRERSRSQGEVAAETAGANSSGRALEKVVGTAEGRAEITRLSVVPFCSTLS